MKSSIRTVILFVSVIAICVVGVVVFSGVVMPMIDEATDEFKRSLPKCEDQVEYVDGGFDDFTKYGEFYYNEENIRKFKENRFFKTVDKENIENLDGYFENYEQVIQHFEHKDKYKFDKSQIKKGDYYYIDSPEGDSAYGKYDNYDVYYVDVEKRIMYFIHSNI